MEGMSGTMHPVNPRKGHDVAPCRHLLAVGGNTPCGGSFLRKSNMLLIIPYLHLLFFCFDFSVVHFFFCVSCFGFASKSVLTGQSLCGCSLPHTSLLFAVLWHVSVWGGCCLHSDHPCCLWHINEISSEGMTDTEGSVSQSGF